MEHLHEKVEMLYPTKKSAMRWFSLSANQAASARLNWPLRMQRLRTLFGRELT